MTIRLTLLAILSIPLFSSIGMSQGKCEKFYHQDPKVFKVKFIEKELPSNISSFEELYEVTPRNIRVVYAYMTRKVPAEVSWVNFGWDMSVLVYRTPWQKALARRLVQGVEVSSLDDPRIEAGDIKFHWQFAAEQRCLNRTKVKWYSFGETVRLGGGVYGTKREVRNSQ
jgi:hypothetical protein